MISFVAGYTKKAFFKNRILAVPEAEAKTQALVVITDAGDTILTPAICARSSMRMRKMTPGISIVRVILSDSGLAIQHDQRVDEQERIIGYRPIVDRSNKGPIFSSASRDYCPERGDIFLRLYIYRLIFPRDDLDKVSKAGLQLPGQHHPLSPGCHSFSGELHSGNWRSPWEY